jgi:gluconate kinase
MTTQLQPLVLVVGVSASGKSWACRQVAAQYHYVPHDRCWIMPGQQGWDPSAIWAAGMGDASRYQKGAKSNHAEVLIAASRIAQKPVLTECPHGERPLREALEAHGIKVIPVFVVEPPQVVAMRYMKREGKPLPKAALTRASTIVNRAVEWGAFKGSSGEVLEYLRGMG